jgi:ligand-binding SRPBCC domain-containing protein
VRERRVTRESFVSAAPDEVWAHATSMTSINREMGPWLRMSYPPEARDLNLDSAEVRVGEPLFISWVSLFGVVPLERMKVTIVERGPGRRFVEQSQVAVLRYWRHERTIAPLESGSVVKDTVTFAPPFAFLAPVTGWLVGLFFAHRHRRLRAMFG